MEGASGNPEEDCEEAKDPDSKDIGKGQSSPATNNSGSVPEYDNNREMEPEETIEEANIGTGSEDHPGRVKSGTPISSARSSYKESQEEKIDSSPEPRSDITSLERSSGLSSQEPTKALSSSKGSKGHPTILGGVRRESSAVCYLSREVLDTVAANLSEKPLGISVSMQTDASWLHDHVYKKKTPREEKFPPENDIYAVLAQDLSCLDILCDTEFREDFLKLFQESLRTLSSVGPPSILAYRPESSRGDIHIEFEKDYREICEFCGSPLRNYPSFESLEKIAEYGYLFCCQQCRELHEFIVSEKNRYAKEEIELIDISIKQSHGSEVERQQARERARQRMKARQMAQQYAYMATEPERGIIPTHAFEYNKQLSTISYCLSEMEPSSMGWTKIPPHEMEEERSRSQDMTYRVSCCDFTIAGGKLLKNQFLQQYYKNGVKFLTIFPDGTAQIFYPSGNLAVIIVRKNEDMGYICIVQEDKLENAEIQAVFDSCGKGTCYHPNGNVWINITIRGGHYSDQAGNKVKTWIWPNNLQNCIARVTFKPVFLSLNQNVGVRIHGQERIVISFLAMGKQAKINIGANVQPLADHHPWPKHVSKDDLLLFAYRIKILRIFTKLHGCLDFPTNDWWAKLQLPSYLLNRALKLIHLCKECEVSSSLDSLISEILNSSA
ncbi:glutamate-rich protein 6 isoform X4 [Rhineura floridana]|uniref:glutamate-rich protein 6 isoform X4 n=1 Tax=Rhineura floridana TaxID=261503 RepID=UPI002AC82574|nr:glutamate-rich protein 6 isoform X4 [Rhineura floridana]